MQCEGQGKPPRQCGKSPHERCTNRAALIRRGWRFGQAGEKPIVWFAVYLCTECAGERDENQVDAEVEARAS